jgi:hypothetical protein
MKTRVVSKRVLSFRAGIRPRLLRAGALARPAGHPRCPASTGRRSFVDRVPSATCVTKAAVFRLPPRCEGAGFVPGRTRRDPPRDQEVHRARVPVRAPGDDSHRSQTPPHARARRGRRAGGGASAASCIGELVKQTREVLEDHSHNPGAASVRFGTVDALLAFLDHDIRPARTRIIETLSDPALTGNEPRSAAPSGSRLDRQPMLSDSAISDAVAPANPAPAAACSPRRSATANARPAHRLNRRKLCTLDVLADLLGDVSRASIGNVIRETRPLLHQDGHIPARVPTATGCPAPRTRWCACSNPGQGGTTCPVWRWSTSTCPIRRAPGRSTRPVRPARDRGQGLHPPTARDHLGNFAERAEHLYSQARTPIPA